MPEWVSAEVLADKNAGAPKARSWRSRIKLVAVIPPGLIAEPPQVRCLFVAQR